MKDSYPSKFTDRQQINNAFSFKYIYYIPPSNPLSSSPDSFTVIVHINHYVFFAFRFLEHVSEYNISSYRPSLYFMMCMHALILNQALRPPHKQVCYI